MRERLVALCPRPFGLAHLAWAILIFAGCVALVLMGGGHPPPMIFVPPLLVAGLLGHLLLRRATARYLIAAVSFGWGIALVLQFGEARPGELPIAVTLIGGLIGMGIYALRSKRIRSVLG